MYLIFENYGTQNTCNVELKRNDIKNYELFIDLENSTFYEESLGFINLNRKKILGKILVFLVVNADKMYFPDEIYKAVWDRKVRGFSEAGCVRTSISRLRNIIEPCPSEWKYILKSETNFWNPTGAYYFNKKAKYCLIMPVKCNDLNL